MSQLQSYPPAADAQARERLSQRIPRRLATDYFRGRSPRTSESRPRSTTRSTRPGRESGRARGLRLRSRLLRRPRLGLSRGAAIGAACDRRKQTDGIIRRWARDGCRSGAASPMPPSALTPAIFQVQPARPAAFAVAYEAWSSSPDMPLRHYPDLYGNLCTRVVLPVGRSVFSYDAQIDVPDATEDVDESARELAPDDLPDDALIYTLPSRYCLPDVLGDEAWQRFGAHPPGLRPGAGDLRSRELAPHLPVRRLVGLVDRRRREQHPARGVPRLHPSGDLVLPGAEHPGPVRIWVSTRPGCAGRPGADGFRGLDGGVAR